MNLRSLLTILAFGLSAHAFGQEPATHFKLRNVAAADAAVAVNAYAAQQKLSVIISAEPVTNTLFVGGDAGHQKKIVEVISALDKAPPCVVVSTTILEVSLDFLKDCGLGDGEKFVLTPREARMLTAAIRREKVKGGVDVISRPSFTITDNQTGTTQSGDTIENLALRITPRISPKGDAIAFKIEAEHKRSYPLKINIANQSNPFYAETTDIQSVQTTESIPEGGTLVWHAVSKKSDKEVRAVLIILSPSIVKESK